MAGSGSTTNVRQIETRLAELAALVASVPLHENDYTYQLIDLGVVRANVAMGLAGTSLTIKRLTGNASIRLNDAGNDLVPLVEGEIYELQFTEIFLTNAAQPGEELEIFVGRRV